MLFRALGDVVVTTADGRSIFFKPKPAAVLSVLILEAPEAVDKDTLLDVVWDGARESDKVFNQIRWIRNTLEAHEPGSSKLVVTDKSKRYRLDGETDIQRFQTLLRDAEQREASGDPIAALRIYEEALGLWRDRGPSVETTNPQLVAAVKKLRGGYSEAQIRRLKIIARSDGWWPVLRDVEHLLADEPYLDRANCLKAEALFHVRGVWEAAAFIGEVISTYHDNGIEISPQMQQMQTAILSGELGDGDSSPETAPQLEASPAVGQGPAGLVVPSGASQRILNNVPSATYSKFIPRKDEWRELQAAMELALPIVGLIGIGGNGKSTLAREFACRAVQTGTPFSAVVWISDKEEPGTTGLINVLDGIALTTENSGVVRLQTEEKSRAVIGILRSLSTLVAIDNYETIRDKALSRWLPTVPDGSKVLITSATHLRDFDEYCVEVNINGMDESEAEALYQQLLPRLNIRDLSRNTKGLTELWSTCGGNPKLIMWALGQVSRRGRDLSDVTAEIGNTWRNTKSRDDVDIVQRTLFRGSWDHLSAVSRDVLDALACFPYGAERDVVRRIAGDPPEFHDAVEELHDLCFSRRLDRGADEGAWYVADPLAASRRSTRESPHAEEIHQRWLDYWVEMAESVGFCPDDVSRLQRLDPTGVRENMEYALRWALENKHFHEVIRIARGARYYYYVRGLWDRQPNIHLMRATAARLVEDAAEEFDARVYHLNIAAKQENVTEVRSQLPRLQQLLDEAGENISPRSVAEYRHARALHLLADGRHSEAEDEWRLNLKMPDVLGPENYNANLRWMAICLARSGPSRAEEARSTFLRAREDASARGYMRAEILIELQLGELTLTQDPSPSAARAVLDALKADAFTRLLGEVSDRRYFADHEWLLARCFERLGDAVAAVRHASRAADIYERLKLTERAQAARALEGK